MQQLDGNLAVALCGAFVIALAAQGCAVGGTAPASGSGGGGQAGSQTGAGGSGGVGGSLSGNGGSGGGQGGSGGGGGSNPTGTGGTGGGGGGATGQGGSTGTGGGGGSVATDGGAGDGSAATPGVHVQYRCTDTFVGPTTSFGINFLIKNLGPIPVDFSTFSIRYWFTADGITDLTAKCETIQPGQQLSCAQVVAAIKAVDPPRTNADSYLEISITPSATATGIGFMGSISQLTIRFQAGAPGVLQSNDYSFDPTFTAFADDPKVTAYAGDTLIWGVEP